MMKNYMKKLISNAFRPLMVGALVLSANWASAQLNGTSYTINSGAASSSTNFVSWSAFATYFNANGITGASTVTVKTNDVTTTATTLTQPATNPTTSTNKLTIDGGGFKLTSSFANEVLGINGVDYLTISNLTIESSNTSTLQSCIRMYGGADYNTIKSCTLQLSGLTTGSITGGAYFAFASSGTSMTTLSTTHNGSYNTIDGCTMRTTASCPGPAYAIVDQQGTSFYTNTPTNNTFSNNTIQNFFYMAIRNAYSNGEEFLNNDISRSNATSNNCNASIFMSYSYYTYATNRSTKFDGNKFHDLPFSGQSSSSLMSGTVYGMQCWYNYGNSTNYFTITNNSFYNISVGNINYFGDLRYNYFVNNSANKVYNWKSFGTGTTWGWYGFYIYNDYKFNNNLIRDCYTKGTTYFVYDYYGGQKQINNNRILNNQTADGSGGSTYGMYLFYPSMSFINECNDNVMDSNSFGASGFAFYHYYWNGTVNRNKITNNRVYSPNTTAYGYFYGMYNVYYYNFTIEQ
jgi:hypothetical protein